MPSTLAVENVAKKSFTLVDTSPVAASVVDPEYVWIVPGVSGNSGLLMGAPATKLCGLNAGSVGIRKALRLPRQNHSTGDATSRTAPAALAFDAGADAP